MLINPIPGTTREQNCKGYDGDSGLDIGVPVGTRCYAVADGWIVYSEHGHTPWNVPPDTPNSVLLELKTPFTYQGHLVRFAWYTHLQSLAQQVPDGSTKVEVKAGAFIGRTGLGNGNPHLHLGLISDRAQGEGQTMPWPLVADLIWDQAPKQVAKPVPAGAAQALGMKVHAHDGEHEVVFTEAIPAGRYKVVGATIGDGFLRVDLGLKKPL